jgi:hypothetical protein
MLTNFKRNPPSDSFPTFRFTSVHGVHLYHVHYISLSYNSSDLVFMVRSLKEED